ncbi:MAG TPA: hypothetical protein VNO32_14630, partial [Candidatus Acidoferrum sp.]|nr:hypothetical protein [Candidatus Acidoferrum sp.]
MNRTASIGVILLFVALFAFPVYPARAASNSHNPIVIVADSDFLTCGCVASGSGTAADPYVIGPMAINGTGGSNIAVSVDGSSLTKSFNLFNL